MLSLGSRLDRTDRISATSKSGKRDAIVAKDDLTQGSILDGVISHVMIVRTFRYASSKNLARFGPARRGEGGGGAFCLSHSPNFGLQFYTVLIV